MEIKRQGRAVIAGCACNCGEFLPTVLKNVAQLATLFEATRFVFVENNSTDQTRVLLEEWVRERPTARLITLGDLARQIPAKTVRLTVARNRYLEALSEPDGGGDYDYLIVLDLDSVNAEAFDLEKFRQALAFLEREEDRAGLFANARPCYYDIWALRHAVWCPTDCWGLARKLEPLFKKNLAYLLAVYSRQIHIPAHRAPIEVDSAFGGLAIYKIPAIVGSRYCGTSPEGGELCEHVAFHKSIVNQGKRLYIFPALEVVAPPGHLLKSERLKTAKAIFSRVVLNVRRGYYNCRINGLRGGAGIAGA